MEEEADLHGVLLNSNACEEAVEKEIDTHGEKSERSACEEALEEEDKLVASLKREIECRDEQILKMQQRYDETLSSFQQVVNGLAEKIIFKDKKLEEMEHLYKIEVNMLVDEKILITSDFRKLQSQNMELDSRLRLKSTALKKSKTQKNLECTRLEKEIKVLKEKLQKQNAMEIDNNNLESQIEVSMLVDENASFISEIRMLQSQNMELDSRLRWKSTALDKIKIRKIMECTRLGNENKALKRELQKQNATASGIKNLESRISGLKKELEEKFKGFMSLESLNKTLVNELQEARDESITLRADLEYHQNLNNTLMLKELVSRRELQEARSESITSSRDLLSNRTTLVIKRLGEIDHKVFQEACLQKFPNGKWGKRSAELCSLWENYLKDANWQPFKTLDIKGKLEEIVDEDDEKLKKLRDEYGEAVYGTVANALLEMNEHNPSGRYLVPEVWNSKKERIATMKEIIQYLVKQVKILKRKR